MVGLLLALELSRILCWKRCSPGAAGVSQVALLVAVGTWTWLSGSVGLLLATPLTVCLVVLGKHVPGFDFLSTLMADSPALSPDVSYYQRLLARDQSEAAEIVQRHLTSQPMETVYDALMLPALNYAERDRIEGRLSEEDEQTVTEQTRELLGDVERIESAPGGRARTRNNCHAPRAHGFAHSGGRGWLPCERTVRCNRSADAGNWWTLARSGWR